MLFPAVTIPVRRPKVSKSTIIYASAILLGTFISSVTQVVLKNGTPHSRYFSDELGVPNFLINTEQNVCHIKKHMV